MVRWFKTSGAEVFQEDVIHFAIGADDEADDHFVADTERLFRLERVVRFQAEERVALRKLAMLDAATRIEDLREAAAVVKGKKVAANVKLALAVPGSGLVKRQAEAEGLDKVFLAAGFEWREPGCSMCLAMNADRLEPGERCASTSNRNFEGRQGPGGRTHLVSPAMAAAAAIAGRFADVREVL